MDWAHDSIFSPILKQWIKFFHWSSKLLWKPFLFLSDKFWSLENANLLCCGFFPIIAPLVLAQIVMYLTCVALELAGLVAILALLMPFSLLIGLPPAVMCSLATLFISLVRLPSNLFCHLLVTYRTVMLTNSLKLTSFILIPLVHTIIPLVTLIFCLLVGGFYSLWYSLIGKPIKPWYEIKPTLDSAWNIFKTRVEEFTEEYGHPSGIPQNWDGRVYGQCFDPVAATLSVILYIISVVPLSLSIFFIFIIKAVPIFLRTTLRCWKQFSFQSAVTKYSETIEKYSKIKIFEKYQKDLKRYVKLLKGLDPKTLGLIVSSYISDCSPLKLIPSNIGVSILFLWIPIIVTSVMWLMGLGVVLTVPPLSFLTALTLWILGWPLVFLIRPVGYCLGWITVIAGMPLLLVLIWTAALTLPWIFAVLGSLSGPLLALLVPVMMIKYSYDNPIDMVSNAGCALYHIVKISASVDRWTAQFSLGDFKLNLKDDDDDEGKETGTDSINYWQLFEDRCKVESMRLQQKKWILSDDVISVSSTVTIAIPAVTIVSILLDTVKRNKKKRDMLIYWNEDSICYKKPHGDNVANLFLPQLLMIKESIFKLGDDIDAKTDWIKASLCDGEDDKSDELKAALENKSGNDHALCVKIRSSVENLVLSLHRVEEMKRRFPEILSAFEFD